MTCEPAVRMEGVQAACPLVRDFASQPVMAVPLSLKATVPPFGVGETVVVKVTEAPKREGFAEEARVVVVTVLLTMIE